jgi:hypothetical protein
MHTVCTPLHFPTPRMDSVNPALPCKLSSVLSGCGPRYLDRSSPIDDLALMQKASLTRASAVASSLDDDVLHACCPPWCHRNLLEWRRWCCRCHVWRCWQMSRGPWLGHLATRTECERPVIRVRGSHSPACPAASAQCGCSSALALLVENSSSICNAGALPLCKTVPWLRGLRHSGTLTTECVYEHGQMTLLSFPCRHISV